MLDVLVELFLIFIGVKKRRKKQEGTSSSTNSAYSDDDASIQARETGVPACAGCRRTLKVGAVYDQGKTWCPECYKTYVLKIKA